MEWKQVLGLAGYLLLAPPAFLFGPLAGLLLLSRPRTAREWTWIVVAGGFSLFWLQQRGDLGGQVLRAAAVLLTGAYVALTLWRPASGWARAVQAAALAGGSLALLMAQTGIRWSELQWTVAYGFRGIVRAMPAKYHAQIPMLTDRLAPLFPALLAAIAIVGVRLAWAWHCRLAERPLGERLCTGELNL